MRGNVIYCRYTNKILAINRKGKVVVVVVVVVAGMECHQAHCKIGNQWYRILLQSLKCLGFYFWGCFEKSIKEVYVSLHTFKNQL
jgi:hypothetical protein